LPLLIVASRQMRIDGTIDASSSLINRGPGSNPTACKSLAAASGATCSSQGASGGGGGGFGTPDRTAGRGGDGHGCGDGTPGEDGRPDLIAAKGGIHEGASGDGGDGGVLGVETGKIGGLGDRGGGGGGGGVGVIRVHQLTGSRNGMTSPTTLPD